MSWVLFMEPGGWKFQKRFFEKDLLDQEKEREEHLLLEMEQIEKEKQQSEARSSNEKTYDRKRRDSKTGSALPKSLPTVISGTSSGTQTVVSRESKKSKLIRSQSFSSHVMHPKHSSLDKTKYDIMRETCLHPPKIPIAWPSCSISGFSTLSYLPITSMLDFSLCTCFRSVTCRVLEPLVSRTARQPGSHQPHYFCPLIQSQCGGALDSMLVEILNKSNDFYNVTVLYIPGGRPRGAHERE
ncbi:hypothetical protein AB205_0221190 [Aquarana catesbeiana]|uniref:Uncharacterized protein n=1 Tax=Aquarana catesbeiana TaxID=8400 RepID=A0A2G9QCI2_AQUCT|nr:hypothetical protein AB205_0221190 [Aquarana catesbeiana]